MDQQSPKPSSPAGAVSGVNQPSRNEVLAEGSQVNTVAGPIAGPPDSTLSGAARCQSEAVFFDRLADQLARKLVPVSAATLERYRAPVRPWFSKEHRFRLLGDLRDQEVLDVGCGEGSNAVMLAMLGARVTGVDLSPRSIDLATRRAALNGVADRTRFICSPLEAATLPEGSFDVVWGDGILHHVIPVLDQVLERLVAWAKDGARAVFSEPVARLGALRRLRLRLPIHTDASPDERPLGPPELAAINRWIPGLEQRAFGLFGRLGRFVLVGNDFEGASAPRRLLTQALALTDYGLLALPGFERLGGMVVLHGPMRKRWLRFP